MDRSWGRRGAGSRRRCGGAGAPEPRGDAAVALRADEVARLLRGAGLEVYTSSYSQATLAGSRLEVTVVVGVARDGSGKLQVTIPSSPGAPARLLVVYVAPDGEAAEEVAEALEEMGGSVDVDGPRVVASFRDPSPGLLARVLSVLGAGPG